MRSSLDKSGKRYLQVPNRGYARNLYPARNTPSKHVHHILQNQNVPCATVEGVAVLTVMQTDDQFDATVEGVAMLVILQT
jgi:hypothetical protein